MARRMNLFHFPLNTGTHIAGWRHPHAATAGLHDLDFYTGLATLAEAACFDAIFFADSLGFYPIRGKAAFASADIVKVEPITLQAAIAARTTHIGLVATSSTTYGSPYHLARQFASLDHLSKGRAAWNVVTSAMEPEARNFGLDHTVGHEERYARAREFVDVVRGLWDSFEDDALAMDKQSGRYLDPDKLHAIGHAGTYYRVAGPLNVGRPPQGHPVLVQAGGSPTGMDFAATYADCVFTSHPGIEGAQAFYAQMKARVRAAGREPDTVKILPSLHPVVGETQADALRIVRELDDLISEPLALSLLETNLGGIDLSGHDPNGPLPEIPATQGIQSVQRRILDWAREDRLTIRQLAKRHAAQRTGNIVAGTAEQVAKVMERWFTSQAADGFMVVAPYLPGGFEAFTRGVVPILQERGLFRRAYEGATLRDHLGLARPENGFVTDPARHRDPRVW